MKTPGQSDRRSSIEPEPNWFEYPVRAYPHHTDYAGIVWHGTYIAWMEEARVEYLRATGVEFADLVALGCDLPVVELSVRYHQSMEMGTSAVVKASMEPPSGVRLNWNYQIRSPDGQIVYLTARVTLVAVDRQKGKIMRRLPASLAQILAARST
ncbi:acyl-CoA thioesterase [Oscillatoriales cyanobacterium LEGE 11467]|uniref:Acyl-CoA thioesterase n=1 Tax=Zarconia navalis LEGE 11467 TaxID=1828826 RepID=A0A928VX41_9CYAN|nr:thioesterase family protein [Zarconia navalis]MBE9041174.1 acyl-CoA thioesterase [Zarconia navalis LEGE 11467]